MGIEEGNTCAQISSSSRVYFTDSEVQLALLDLLKIFADYCDSHGLRYSLDGGTLLGAIRHKGFIPWDDDIDVMMPRPDFERLRTMEDVSSDLRFLGMGKGNPLPFIKFSNMKIRAQEPTFDSSFKEYLWVDVFPVDGVPEDEKELNSFYKKKEWCGNLAMRLMSPEQPKNPVKRAFKALARKTKFAHALYRRMDKLCRRYDYCDHDVVGDTLWSAKPKSRCKRDSFDNRVKLQFEDSFFWAICDWDSYLTVLYGDYMQLPPVEERESHCLKVWEE